MTYGGKARQGRERGIMEQARIDALPRERIKYLSASQGITDPRQRTIPETRDRFGLTFVVILFAALVGFGVLVAAGTGVGQ